MPKEVEFDTICDDPSAKGYVLDFEIVVIEDRGFDKDIDKVIKKIKNCIKKIEEGTEEEIQMCKIHKTYARREEGIEFDLEDPRTWKDKIIKKRYSERRRIDHINGMVVIAAVDEGISNAQEYTLSLKEKVVKKLMEEENSKIKGTTRRGNEDDGRSPGYVLYLTYKF